MAWKLVWLPQWWRSFWRLSAHRSSFIWCSQVSTSQVKIVRLLNILRPPSTWLYFCRRYLFIHFLGRKEIIKIIQNSFIRVEMVWHWTGDTPLAETLMVYLTKATLGLAELNAFQCISHGYECCSDWIWSMLLGDSFIVLPSFSRPCKFCAASTCYSEQHSQQWTSCQQCCRWRPCHSICDWSLWLRSLVEGGPGLSRNGHSRGNHCE